MSLRCFLSRTPAPTNCFFSGATCLFSGATNSGDPITNNGSWQTALVFFSLAFFPQTNLSFHIQKLEIYAGSFDGNLFSQTIIVGLIIFHMASEVSRIASPNVFNHLPRLAEIKTKVRLIAGQPLLSHSFQLRNLSNDSTNCFEKTFAQLQCLLRKMMQKWQGICLGVTSPRSKLHAYRAPQEVIKNFPPFPHARAFCA